jgi:hypothetical protein
MTRLIINNSATTRPGRIDFFIVNLSLLRKSAFSRSTAALTVQYFTLFVRIMARPPAGVAQ